MTVSENGKVKVADRAKYQGFVCKMTTQEFVEDVVLERDCLAQLAMLSNALQNRSMNFVMAHRHIKWTMNSLSSIKAAVSDGKYSFDIIFGSNKASTINFKEVPLHKFSSRRNYYSFDRLQFVQSLIDNMRSRMLQTDEDNEILRCFEVLIPDLLPTDIQIPWFNREAKLFQLCNRFHVPEGEMITCFREFAAIQKISLVP